MNASTKSALGAVAAFASIAFATSARADEQAILAHPGEHPDYHLELEPHALLAYGGPFYHWNGDLGAGVRGSIALTKNGPLPSINNNVALGVGADFFFFRSGEVFVPVVVQWNFFLLSHFSVYGEAGAAGSFGTFQDWGPILGIGGRVHFSDRMAITLRLEYPATALGLSIFI